MLPFKKSTPSPWWLTAMFGGMVMCFAAVVTPGVLRDIRETDALKNKGLHAAGRVAGHRTEQAGTGPKKRIVQLATIEYSVDNGSYSVEIRGEGATPESLPVESRVDVVYVRDHPEIAAVKVDGAENGRGGYADLFLVWGVGIVLWVAAFYAWKKIHFGGPHHARPDSPS
jgi:hypothetical protein